MASSKSQKKGILLMILCASMWSVAGIIFKFISWSSSGLFNGFAIAGARSFIAAVVMLIGMPLIHRKIVFTKYSMLGGLFAFLTFTCFVVSNQFTTAANAIVLQYTGPIFIIIEGFILYKQRFTKLDIITSVVTFLGIGLFVFDSLGTGHIFGDLVSLAAGFSFGTMFLIVGKGDDNARMSAAFIGHVLTAVVGLPFLAFADKGFTPHSVMWIFVLGIFQLGIPYMLYAVASGYCSALTLSLTSVVEPLLNPVWVVLFFGEKPTITALIGAAVVLTAVTARSVIIARDS